MKQIEQLFVIILHWSTSQAKSKSGWYSIDHSISGSTRIFQCMRL